MFISLRGRDVCLNVLCPTIDIEAPRGVRGRVIVVVPAIVIICSHLFMLSYIVAALCRF